MRTSKLTTLFFAALFTASLFACGAVRLAQSHAPKPTQLYDAAEEAFGGWLLKVAPEPLRARGPYKLLWAQWLGLPLVALVAWLVGIAMNRTSRALLRPLVRRTVARWDDALLRSASAPVTLAWTLIAAYFLVPILELRPPALAAVHQVLRVVWVGCLFWALARAVDVVSQVISATALGPSARAQHALLPLTVRASKLVVFALAIVALLSEAGYSVGTLIAGLGVGGLAVALAARNTFEHWLGAFAIALDQPFREGDFVKIDGLQGTIERIGMRSTRVRTLDRTIVSIPNGKLAEMQPETFTPRDRMRLALDLRLVYGTTTDQVREILAGVDRVLRDQPKLREDGLSVVLRELGVTAIVIEIVVFFDTVDANEFNAIRQDVLLQIMGVVDDAGTRLAVPAQRVELVSDELQLSAASESPTGVISRRKLPPA